MKEKDKTTNLARAAEGKISKPKAFDESRVPFFVEAEKMFERFADISMETTNRAFDFFRARGGEFGHEVEDWFRAESDILRFVPVEIKEQNGTLKVSADVAGFKPEEVEISVKDNTLMISGKMEAREEKKDENVFYSDFRSNRFFRQMTLPEAVKVEDAKAEIKDGMLNISLPKIGKSAPKNIAVSAG